MSNKRQIVLFLAIVSIISSASAKLETTYTVNSPIMKKISEWVDKDTLVFVDLDDTVITPKSLMFAYKANPYRSFIDDMINLGKKLPYYNVVVAKWYQQRSVKLVEESWSEYIQKLQSNGAVVYGVCDMPLQLVNIEKKRYQELEELKVNFNNIVNDKETLLIEKHDNWSSLFYKGIIFTVPYSRSHTLMEFLKVTNRVPSKMLFISSVKADIDRVERDLRVFDMKFYNVLYLGVEDIQGKPDSEVVKFQQQELIKTGRWMEDDTAKTALQQYKKNQLASPRK